MLAVNYSTVRENFKSYCDKVTDDNETIIVSRKNEKNIVIISLNEWNAMQKSIHNVQYLSKLDYSISEIEDGRTITKSIQELEEMANE